MNSCEYSEEDLLSLSGIQHFYFCKRQWALIHIERQWEDNQRTVEGHHIHERADDPFCSETRGEVITSRAYPLVSYRLGLYGVADVIEYVRSSSGITLPGHEGLWQVYPVEYKRGKPKIDERDEVQLCAQAMCLEEMLNIRIDRADFFYHEIRRRVHLSLTNNLRELVCSLCLEMHQVFRDGITPVATTSQNCKLCSLVDVCVPKLTLKNSSVPNYIQKHLLDTCIPEKPLGKGMEKL